MAIGRPLDFDRPAKLADGTVATLEDRIIELMGAGSSVETAATAAGLNRTTLHGFLRLGARTSRAILEGKLSHPDDPDGEAPLPDHKALRCMAFVDRVDTARHRWLALQEARLERATAGGHTRTTVTIKTDATGKVLERTEKTEVDGPDMPTLRWRLERLFPKQYGHLAKLEVSGPDGDPIPLDARVSSLLNKVQAARAAGTEEESTTDEPQDRDDAG